MPVPVRVKMEMMEKYSEAYPPVLSVDEVASILGVTAKTVRNLIKPETSMTLRLEGLSEFPKTNSLIIWNNKTERRFKP